MSDKDAGSDRKDSRAGATADDAKSAEAALPVAATNDSDYEQRFFESTRNPLFVWRAILHRYRNPLSREPFPDWILRYLFAVAWRLNELSEGRDWRQFPKGTNNKAPHGWVGIWSDFLPQTPCNDRAVHTRATVLSGGSRAFWFDSGQRSTPLPRAAHRPFGVTPTPPIGLRSVSGINRKRATPAIAAQIAMVTNAAL
jgi:hypothetical protein